MSFNNKVIWITGASSGIGKALAELLLSKNYLIFGADRLFEINFVVNDPFFAWSGPHSIEGAYKPYFLGQTRFPPHN